MNLRNLINIRSLISKWKSNTKKYSSCQTGKMIIDALWLILMEGSLVVMKSK